MNIGRVIQCAAPPMRLIELTCYCGDLCCVQYPVFLVLPISASDELHTSDWPQDPEHDDERGSEPA